MLSNRQVIRQIRSVSRYGLGLVVLSSGCLSSACWSQTKETGKNKPKTDQAPTPAGKPPASPNTKKADAPSMPLKPEGGVLGAASPGGVGPLAVPAGPKLTAEDWEKRGSASLAARKFDAAVAAFNESVQLKSANPSAWLGLGVAYESKQMYPEAAKAFRALVNLTPTAPQSYALLANALLRANQNEAALPVLDRAIELSPNPAELYIREGSVYLQQKEYADAQRVYLQAVGIAPDNASAHTGLGDVYEQGGKHSEALAEYDAALRLDPEYLPARLSRATSLAGVGRLREGEELLAKISDELENSAAQLKTRLATVGGDARATAQVQAQIAQIPLLQANVQTTLALMLDTPQRREDAIKAYQAALKLTPDSATIWGNLGWTQYEAGQNDAAIVSSRKALELDGSLAYVRLNLGLIYAVQNNWTEAQKEYRQAIVVSTASDLEGGIKDVREAQSKQPASSALQQSLNFLTSALEKAVRALPKAG